MLAMLLSSTYATACIENQHFVMNVSHLVVVLTLTFVNYQVTQVLADDRGLVIK